MEKQIQNYLKILKTTPDNVPAFEALVKIYMDSERWGELAELYVNKAQQTGDENKIPNLLFDAAEIFAERLANFDRVEDCYFKILDRDADNQKAFELLRQRYLDAHKWDRLINLLEKQADKNGDVVKQAGYLNEIAGLWARELDNEEKQIEYLKKAQKANPDDLVSLRQLKIWYLKSFEVDAALKLVEKEDALLENKLDKAELYLEVGRLLSEDPFEKDRAIEFLEKVAEHTGKSRAKKAKQNLKLAESRLKELKGLDKNWESITRDYMEEAINVSDKREASSIYLKIAGIFFLYASDRKEDIMSSIEKSLLLDSANRRGLLLGERYLGQEEEWENLAEFLSGVASRTRDNSLKVEADAKRATVLADHLDRREEALEIFNEVIKLNPDHLLAFDFVCEDLKSNDRWDDLEELLNHRLENCNELTAKVATHLELAVIAVERKDDTNLAVEHYEKVLELSPGNIDASRALPALYEQTENWEKLLDVFPGVIEASEDKMEKSANEKKMADLLKDKMDNPEEAYDHYLNAFALDPSEENLRIMDELTIELECWEKLVDALVALLEKEETAENYRRLKFRLGQVYDRELSQYEDAEKCYMELIQDEQDMVTLDALAKLYAKDLRWDEYVDVFKNKAELAADNEERRDILMEVARVFEEEIPDNKKQIEAYNDVVATMPDELEALKRLEELHQQEGNSEELAEVIERELEVIVSIPEKIKLNFKLGRVYNTKLENLDSATVALLTVLELDPAHLPAIEMLEEMLQKGVKVEDIFHGLEEYYRKLEKWDKLADGYEALYKSEEDSFKKGELCHKLADIYLRYRDLPDKAYDWITEALDTNYDGPDYLTSALEIARKVNNQSDLLELLESKAGDIEDDDASVRFSLSLGSLYWDAMQDEETANQHYLSASEKKPEDVEVLKAVSNFFDSTKNFENFVAYSSRLAEVLEDADEKKAVLFKVANVFESELQNNGGAREVLGKILADNAGDKKALENLLRLQQADGDYDDAVLTLIEMLEHSDEDKEKTDIRMNLALIYEAELEDTDEAAKLYQTILEQDPKYKDAISAAESLLENSQSELIVADTLRPIYEEQNNFAKLVEVLKIQQQNAEGDDAYRLAVKVAEIYQDSIEDYSSAFDWYGKAFVLDSGVALLKELMIDAEMAERFDSFVEIGEEKLSQDLTDEDRAQLLSKVAEVANNELSDTATAKTYFEQLLQIDEKNETALDSMIGFARASEDNEELAELLDKKRQVAEEKNIRREAALELSDIYYNNIDRIEDAIEILQELMAERENDPQVFERMEAIFEEQELYEELCDLLETKLKYLREDDDILPLKIQIGSTFENRLDQPEKAMEIYHDLVSNYWSYPVVGSLVDRLLSQESTELAIANEMEQKYIKTQDWPRLVTVYEIQLRYTEDADEKLNLLNKLSGIYQDKLQDAEKAFEGFARVFVDDPNNETALSELEKLAGDLGIWNELAEVYVRAGDASENDDEATELFIKAARLYEDILALQDDAIRVFRKVLDRDRNNMTAIQALEGLCRKAERWEDLRDIYLQRVELTEDEAEKKEFYANICIVYEHNLGDPLGATPYHEAILELSPSDIGVVDTLLGLYELLGDWEKKVDMLGRKLELVEAGEERNLLMLDRAALLEDKIEDFISAKDLFKAVLEADEENTQARAKLEDYVEREEFQLELAKFLEPYYEQWEEWNLLIDMLEYQFSNCEELDERVRLLKEIAVNYEENLDQSNLAYAVYTRAFRELPTDENVQQKLDELAGVLGQFEQLSGLYEEQIEISGEEDVDTSVNLLLNLAKIEETYLQNVEAASAHYRRVLELSENHESGISNLERIYSLQKEWPSLIDILECKLVITEELEDKKSVLFEMASIFEEELGDNIQAIATYRRILDLDSNDTDVLRSLVRLTRTEEMWNDLLEIRQRQLDINEDQAEGWRLRYEMGRVLWNHLDKVDEAIDTFHAILNENHSHGLCRSAMEDLFNEEATELRAAEILEPLYNEDERYLDLVSTLAIQAKHAEQATDRRDLFLRMSALAEDYLNNSDRAFAFTVSAFENDAFNEEIREQMERLSGVTERWEDLAFAYKNMAQNVEEVSEQVDLFLNAGRVALRELEDLNAAEGYYSAVRERQQDNSDALEALQEIFENTLQWPELVDVLFTKADLTDDSNAKIALYTNAAEVRENKMQTAEEAVDCYNKALDVDAEHIPSLTELDRLYTELSRFTDLRDILVRRIALADTMDEKLSLTYRMGNVVESEINDSDAALEIYGSILNDNDEYEDAIQSLENMVADTGLQGKALAILLPLFENKSWWEREADILEVQLDTLSVKEERLAVLDTIKQTYEHKLSDAARAFQVACRIFEENVYDTNARQEMERLAVVTGGFEGLVNTYRFFLDQVDDDQLKIEILGKIARIFEEQLQDDEQAIEAYRSVFEMDPANFTAILALDRLYERLERFSDLVELIPKEFALYEDKKQILDLRLRLGKLWEEKMQDNQTSIEVYYQVLTEQPDNPTALTALARLYENEEMWPELIENYKSEVRIARGDTKKARLYDKMAQVYYANLNESRKAIPLWNRVLQFDESNEEVREKLENLYGHEEMWDELVGHYKKRLRLARSTKERASITGKMANVYRERLNQEDQATQLYLKVLEYTPEDLSVIDTLEEIYLKNQSWRELADLLTRLLEQVDGAELRSLNLRLASMHLEQLNNIDEGMKLTRKVLDMEPTVEELSRLEGMFSASSEHNLYLEILGKQLQATEDTEQIIELNFKMADIRMRELNDSASACASLEKVFELDNDNLKAAQLLAPIYEENSNWLRLIDVLQIQLAKTETLNEINAYKVRIADIFEGELSDYEHAFDSLLDVFRANPADAKLLERMESLSERIDKHQEFAGLLTEVLLDVEAGSELYRTLTYKVASVYESKMFDKDQAAYFYQNYIDTSAYDEHAADYLVEYYEEQREWDKLVATYQGRIPYMSEAEKVDIGCKVASLFFNKMDQTERSIKTYEQVLKMDDSCTTAIDSLIDIHEMQEDWDVLVELLRKKLHLVEDQDRISEIRMLIAGLYKDKLADLKQAKIFYRALVADNPRHGQALDELENIYIAEENYDELLEVLSRRVNVTEDNGQKITIYLKMAEIWETRFEQLDMAVNYFEKILALESNNMLAIESLERIYKESGNWPNLVLTYQRHIDQTIDSEEIIDLYTRMGSIYGEYLFQPSKAIDYFNKALTMDENNFGVLSALSELYIANELWEKGIETLENMAALAEEKNERVAALDRLGHLYLTNLEQPEKAKAVYDRMLDEDPTFVPALNALRRYYATTEDWDAFMIVLEDEKKYVVDALQKAEVLFEEGKYYHEQQSDVDRALRLYRESLDMVEDYQPALEVLGKVFFERQQWEETRPLLEKLLEKSADMENKEVAKLNYQLAYIAEQMDDQSAALKYYTESYKLNSSNLDTLEGLARTLYIRGDWERAFRVYQTILVRFRDKKSVPELVELFCRLGEVNGKLGKNDVAVRMYEKALELDSDSSRALNAIVFFYESLENWKKALQFRSLLIKKVEGDELFEQWKAVGDIYSGKLEMPDRGLEAYRNALEIRANDSGLLNKVAELLLEAGNTEEAIMVLRSAAAIEEDPQKILEINYRLGNMVREHGQNPELCLDYYNAALDAAPARIDIFMKIEEFLTAKSDWEALDINYRLMIARIPDDEVERRQGMWKKLGDLLADKAGNLEDAIQVWEVVAQFDPEDLETKEHIAELYGRSPLYKDKAIAIHRELLERDPKRVNSYRALWKINFEAEEFDRAYCYGGPVDLLGAGETPAASFYRDNLASVKLEGINSLDHQAWGTLLTHDDARHNVGQVLNILFHHASGLMPSDLKKEGLKKKDKLNLNEDYNICTTTTSILKTLGLPLPEIYMRRDYGPGAETLQIQPASLMIGADAFENFPVRKLAFLMARNGVLARPDVLMVTMLKNEEILSILDASALNFNAGFDKVHSDRKKLKGLQKKLDKAVPKKLKEMLSALVGEYMKLVDELDVDKWRKSLHITSCRAGLLMCGDIKTAVETIKEYPQGLTEEDIEEVTLDLIRFSTSDNYFHLRNYLGFSIV